MIVGNWAITLMFQLEINMDKLMGKIRYRYRYLVSPNQSNIAFLSKGKKQVLHGEGEEDTSSGLER
jgi:hypothetical protein